LDGVPVTVDSYVDANTMGVTVPPCPEMIERPIQVEVRNCGSGGDPPWDLLAYRDFPPTVGVLSPGTGTTHPRTVTFQADARDDVWLSKVEYWYAFGAGPHYHPTDRAPTDPVRTAYENGDWDPALDTSWTAVWTLIDSLYPWANAWPWSVEHTFASDGMYSITAVAYDNHTASAINPKGAQAQTAESPATVTVSAGSNAPPVVTISSPPDGADVYAAGGNIFLSASATDADSTVTDIQFWYLDGDGFMQPLGNPDPNTMSEGSSAALLWDGEVVTPIEMTAQDGPLYIIAEAVSDSGPSGFAGIAVNVVSDAAADLSVSWIDPAGSDYAGASGGNPATVTIYGSGFVDDDDQDVTVYFEGVEAGNVTVDASGTWLTADVPHIPDSVPEGPVTVRVEVTDSRGRVIGSAERADLFTVTDSAPSVAIASPADGADVGDGVVIVADAFDDRGVTGLVFDVDGTVIGTATSCPYSVVWDMTLVDPAALGGYGNPHTITATASDGINADSVAAVTVTPTASGFDNPPVVAVTRPSNGATVSDYAVPITVVVTTDTGEDLSGTVTLEVIDSGTGQALLDLAASLVPDADNPVTGATNDFWTFSTAWDTAMFPDGSFYLLRATATDDGGNVGVVSVNVTVRNAPVVDWFPPHPPDSWINRFFDHILICGGAGGGTPLPLLVAMMAAAVPLLSLRRSRVRRPRP
jgi:hypothetical protein